MLMEILEKRQFLAAAVEGVGVLGDSYTDEYQFYAPDRSTADNYVEQLAEDRHLDFGRFTNSSRTAPRASPVPSTATIAVRGPSAA